MARLGGEIATTPADGRELRMCDARARDARRPALPLREASATWASGNRVSELVLGVFPENLRAIGGHERHGFVREGLRRAPSDRAGRYHDGVLMARFLTPAS